MKGPDWKRVAAHSIVAAFFLVPVLGVATWETVADGTHTVFYILGGIIAASPLVVGIGLALAWASEALDCGD